MRALSLNLLTLSSTLFTVHIYLCYIIRGGFASNKSRANTPLFVASLATFLSFSFARPSPSVGVPSFVDDSHDPHDSHDSHDTTSLAILADSTGLENIAHFLSFRFVSFHFISFLTVATMQRTTTVTTVMRSGPPRYLLRRK